MNLKLEDVTKHLTHVDSEIIYAVNQWPLQISPMRDFFFFNFNISVFVLFQTPLCHVSNFTYLQNAGETIMFSLINELHF